MPNGSGKEFFAVNYSNTPVLPDLGEGGQGAVEPLDPPIFGRSVNPIPTGEGILSPPITTGPPQFFHLPASLHSWQGTFMVQ